MSRWKHGKNLFEKIKMRFSHPPRPRLKIQRNWFSRKKTTKKINKNKIRTWKKLITYKQLFFYVNRFFFVFIFFCRKLNYKIQKTHLIVINKWKIILILLIIILSLLQSTCCPAVIARAHMCIEENEWGGEWREKKVDKSVHTQTSSSTKFLIEGIAI